MIETSVGKLDIVFSILCRLCMYMSIYCHCKLRKMLYFALYFSKHSNAMTPLGKIITLMMIVLKE